MLGLKSKWKADFLWLARLLICLPKRCKKEGQYEMQGMSLYRTWTCVVDVSCGEKGNKEEEANDVGQADVKREWADHSLFLPRQALYPPKPMLGLDEEDEDEGSLEIEKREKGDSKILANQGRVPHVGRGGERDGYPKTSTDCLVLRMDVEQKNSKHKHKHAQTNK
jgi:hypothetical protein